jgi:hypothetical protein
MRQAGVATKAAARFLDLHLHMDPRDQRMAIAASATKMVGDLL